MITAKHHFGTNHFSVTFASPKNSDMNHQRAFEIPFVGLKTGVHNYEYQIDDKFFSAYGEQDFTNCTARIKLELDKKNNFMLLKFDVDGSIGVSCDRCGNPISLQLWDEFRLMIKIVDEPELMNEQEDDPEVYYISKSESHLHVENWIYEFINLSIPMQKMCPEDEVGGPQCNKNVLEKLRKMQSDIHDQNNDLFKKLEQFKNQHN